MANETRKPTPPHQEIETSNKTLNTPTTIDLNQDSSPADAVAADSASKGSTKSVVSPTANDIQKKMKRAERFGVPVLMSEQEKRNSRSQRFGIGVEPEESKSAEQQKRKARADRFGISVPADEEVKKKFRAERFGASTKVDSVEEDKRKARALRFSQIQATGMVHSNDNGDSGSKNATVDNASGGA